MEQIRTLFDTHFSLKALLYGLSGVLGVYALLLAYVVLQGSATLKKHGDHLAADVVLLEPDMPHVGPQENLGGAQVLLREGGEISSAQAHPPADSGDALRPAPIEGFYQTTDKGLLPTLSPSGARVFDIYKRPFANAQDQAVIAILVTNYGLSAQLSDQMLSRLPPDVSVMLSPYTHDIDHWKDRARAYGHEVWIQLVMETETYPEIDSGPKTLQRRFSLKDNLDLLEWHLAQTNGYAGVAAFVDDRLGRVQPLMQALAKDVFSRGVGYFDMNPEATDVVETNALAYRGAYVRTNFVIDDTDLTKQLQALETKALADKYVSGVLVLLPNQVDAFAAWAQGLEDKNIILAPVSAVYDHQKSRL